MKLADSAPTFHHGGAWWAYAFGKSEETAKNDAPNISVCGMKWTLDVIVNAELRTSQAVMRRRIAMAPSKFDHLVKSHGQLEFQAWLNAVALSAFEQLFKTSKGEGPVFVTEGGDALKGYKHWFEDAVAEAGLKDFTWYCLRHTFASRLVMAAVDIRTVAELMGHKTIQMTMRYAHLAPEHQQAAVERLCPAPAADHEQERQTQEAKGTAITPWVQTATTSATSTLAPLTLSASRSTISPVFVTSSTQRGPVAQRLEQWTHKPK